MSGLAGSRLRGVALGGLGVFVALVALQQALVPGLPPAEHFVSEYANAETGAVQVAAFLAWALGLGACALVAARIDERRRPVARALTALALALAAGGAVLTALFATQTVAGELPPGTARTLPGRLHDLGSLAIFAALLVAAPASVRLVVAWRYRLAVLVLLVALVAIVPALVALGVDAPGWGQRAFIAVACAWQLAFVLATARAPGAPREDAS